MFRGGPSAHVRTAFADEAECQERADAVDLRQVGADLQASLLNYLKLYYHHISQRAIGSKTPILALKEWQQKLPELFLKRVYDQTGIDT